ncbi:hypothetical protein ACWXVT_02220 [Mycoplasma sp. 1573]
MEIKNEMKNIKTASPGKNRLIFGRVSEVYRQGKREKNKKRVL